MNHSTETLALQDTCSMAMTVAGIGSNERFTLINENLMEVLHPKMIRTILAQEKHLRVY